MHVVMKLKNGDTIVGSMGVTQENTVDIHDALVVHYSIFDDVPHMYFAKYCLFNISFDVSFQKDMIANIFTDPVPSFIDYYKTQLAALKRNYLKRANETYQRAEQPEIPDEFVAMMEKFKDDPEVH